MAAAVPTTSSVERNAIMMLGIGAALVLTALVMLEQRAAPLRLEAARLAGLELAEESKAFCEKHGIPASAQGHQSCTSDLQLIRDKQSERISREFGFGY